VVRLLPPVLVLLLAVGLTQGFLAPPARARRGVALQARREVTLGEASRQGLLEGGGKMAAGLLLATLVATRQPAIAGAAVGEGEKSAEGCFDWR
jgi:hypothetical protein